MSASSTLVMPAGAVVRSATLYIGTFANSTNSDGLDPLPWSADLTTADVSALFAGPSGPYTAITPLAVTPYNGDRAYQARYDVTGLVSDAGAYWVANPTLPPATHLYSRTVSWVLVVVYDDDGPPKLVNLYDGYLNCFMNTTAVELTGFRTPAVGAVNAQLSSWCDDGDASVSGESIRVGTATMSNAANPANNIGNSSVSDASGPLTRDPMTFRVTESVDIDSFDASAGFTNGQTSATVTFTCGNLEGVTYEAAVLAFDVFAPEVTLVKRVIDDDGGLALPGDTLTYEIDLRVTGGDDARDVIITDTIPANTTYVPGTITYTSGMPIGAWTDATGDDVAEIAAGVLTMRVGMGATETSGGTIAVGSTVTMRFSVRVDALTAPTEIANTAVASLLGVGGGTGTTRIEVVSRATAGGAEGPTVIDATPCAEALVDGGVCVGVDGGVDAGLPAVDGGGRLDASIPRDGGGATADSGPGTMAEADGGCGCRFALASSSSGSRGWGLLSGLALALALAMTRRRRS